MEEIEFLQLVADTDLSEYKEAYIEVNGEVTHHFSEKSHATVH